MSKRFTDTAKWDDPFFTELPLHLKCFWVFLVDKCDNAGVWIVNKRSVEFFIGMGIDLNEALRIFDNRILVFDDGKKWLVRKFINFQYGILAENSKMKIGVENTLKKHNLTFDDVENTLSIGYLYPINTPQVKVKVKEEVEVKEEVKVNAPQKAKIPTSQYSLSMEVYSDFMKKQGVPAKIDGVEGNALKAIIKYLNDWGKSDGISDENIEDESLAVWRQILDNFNKWTPFHQNNIKLAGINTQLVNIIRTLKDGKQGKTGKIDYTEFKQEIANNLKAAGFHTGNS